MECRDANPAGSDLIPAHPDQKIGLQLMSGLNYSLQNLKKEDSSKTP